MALLNRKRAAAPQQPTRTKPRSMVASAAIVQQSTLRSVAARKPWQEQAWDYYDTVGELHSAVGWLGHALSRCKLYVGELPDDATQGDPKPSADERAQQPLDELFGGPSGHAEMLSRLAVHLSVPGESFVIALDVDQAPDDTTGAPTPAPVGPDGQPLVDPGVRRWLVASTDEFEQDRTSGTVTVQLPDSDRRVTVDVERSTVLRLWRPHARRAWDADSPSRACLDALRELVTCSAHINASLESRLAGAGMLIMPASATIPTNGQGDDEPGDELHDDPQYSKLIEAMVTPISDRDSASAVVPIMVRVDDESMSKVQYITFATPLDANVQRLREAAIRRLALGLDVPPEVLLGMTDANHWTGWQIEESAVKLSVEPLLTLIVNALTTNYLRPALAALGVTDPDRFVIWYDVSELVLRPNRFEQAVALWREGLLGAAAVLREGGFSEQDVPTSAERAEALLLKLVTSNVSPDVARPYLLALGLPAPEATATPGVGDAAPPEPTERPAIEPGDQQRDPPQTPGDPDNPAPAGEASAALVAAGDAGVLRVAALELAVLRALEFAGKRLLSGAGRSHRGSVTGPAWSIHTRIRAADADLDRLLDGAYATLDTSPVLRRDRALVDYYVRSLLAAGVDHRPAYLVAALQQRGDVDGPQAQQLAGRVASYAAA